MFKQLRVAPLAMLIAAAAVLPAWAGAPLDGDNPERFVVVDHRIASMVAATPDAQNAAVRETPLGRSVFIGQTFEWHDGRTCDLWYWDEGAGPDIIAEEPSLADLMLPVGGDAANFVPVSVTCHEEPFVEFVQVDARVMISMAANGAAYVVLERAMEADEAMAVQQALADRRLYDGPIDGVIDNDVRRGISRFIAAETGGPAPQVGILTQGVVDALLAE